MRRRWSIRGNRRSAGAKKNVDCWAVGERGGEGIIYSECNPLDERSCKERYEKWAPQPLLLFVNGDELHP